MPIQLFLAVLFLVGVSASHDEFKKQLVDGLLETQQEEANELVEIGKHEQTVDEGAAQANYNATTGMTLTKDLCPDKSIDDLIIGTVSVYCESLHKLSTVPDAYHCGFQAAAEDQPSIVRRYDLGPRPFQLDLLNPLAILAISIHCTEGGDLHGKKAGIEQILWPDATEATAIRRSTFGQLEKFIETRNIVSNHYDLIGGNCQHFSFLLYELMVKKPCFSIERPNDDSVAEITSFLGPAGDAIVSALQSFSSQFQEEQAVRTSEWSCE